MLKLIGCLHSKGKEEEPAHCIEAIRRQMDIGVKRMEEQQSLIDGGSLIRTDEAVEDADRYYEVY